MCGRLEQILDARDPDFHDFGLNVVKIDDKKTAKQHGILTFPGLTIFRAAGQGINYEGRGNLFILCKIPTWFVNRYPSPSAVC